MSRNDRQAEEYKFHKQEYDRLRTTGLGHAEALEVLADYMHPNAFSRFELRLRAELEPQPNPKTAI